MKYSPIFPMEVNPVHKGWYQTKEEKEPWDTYYNYWNGAHWCDTACNLNDTKVLQECMNHVSGFVLQNWRAMVWRGITKD